MIDAKIILDSLNPFTGNRITTFQLIYPRFIHSEMMTHRVFSRSSASSRAIPVKKMISSIESNTAMPFHWGKNQKGMSAQEENNAPLCIPIFSEEMGSFEVSMTREEAWLHARDLMIQVANAYDRAGYHKQIVNRLLEPFTLMKVCLTSTYFQNFFDLRTDINTAQPEIVKLASLMKDAMDTSIPIVQYHHIPWILDSEKDLPIDDKMKISAARSARVSYETFDTEKKSDIESDLKLCQRLLDELHLSPFEHQATAINYIEIRKDLASNFEPSWLQYRKEIENEKRIRTHK